MRSRKRRYPGRFFPALLIATLAEVGVSGERFQVVYPDPETVGLWQIDDEPIAVDFLYTTEPRRNNELSGLGLRLHFNDRLLTLLEIENELQADLFRIVDVPEPDAEDFDGDPETNVLIRLIWVDAVDRTWPGPDYQLPVRLFTASFNVSESTEQTFIRVTPISVAVDHGFRTRPVAVLGGPRFRRGDANADGSIQVTDAIVLFGWLFMGSAEPLCLDAVDVDDLSGHNITDGIYLLQWLFLGGPPPPAPGPHECGRDPSDDDIGCESFPPCLP